VHRVDRDAFSGRDAVASRPARVTVTEDRYDDNEDKRGAKFLVGIADPILLALGQSKSDMRQRGTAVKLPPTLTETSSPEIPSESRLR